MGLSNDERGWVMTSLSGVACVIGASVICVDIIVRLFPGKKNFRIQDSDTFLSASLSLSFGVMLFSSLFSMLPNSKSSLIKSGFDAKTATWIMVACFLGGFVGIQFLSRIMHKFIPSHVVDCEHTHEDEESSPKETHHSHSHIPTPRAVERPKRLRTRTKSSLPGHLHQPDPPSPRASRTNYFNNNTAAELAPTIHADARASLVAEGTASAPTRPSFTQRLTTRLSRLTTPNEEACNSDGPCKGYSDLCGSECFKNVNKPSLKAHSRTRESLRQAKSFDAPGEATPLLKAPNDTRETQLDHPSQPSDADSMTLQDEHHGHTHDTDDSDENGGHHHHHVPTNAFLSIGLQTSIAIALHKLPEGFITYATNHANPQLGFAVFLALFIHNITEGFAMALPLYLAINSRLKAMLWSFVLGGLSQPLGAGVAALWFKIAGSGKWAPNEGVYGGMFAVTAGIMVSVALQLFSESLDLTHNRTLCMIGAISGMCILGISSALTA
ncbi:hypothetical protein AMS68_005742 [Peltaster fructicola]|uniref:Zinc/iron permease n=1 Tax=Peltaster fructicola TaxID=286661 RepID=A0A6H0XZY9_9PEZI|nr:hypothetical protein AMS68_005742 [Peltaster fructicola]